MASKKVKSLRVDVLSVFPEMISAYADLSILGRAQKAKLLDVRAHQLRDWSNDKHRRVDDKAYGGGPGMLMKVEPFHRALVAMKLRTKQGKKTAAAKKTHVILTSAKGTPFTQKEAHRLAKYDRLVFLCGRYEGVDERVATHLVDEEMSVGPYVMTGGELAALVMTDAVARLRPGVLGKEASLDQESWSEGMDHEYPQFTRPEDYNGWNVPKELLSGHHKNIEAWRKGESK
ncbi:MAG: tRNA (guanosine(37)-N1)-methyltransferase TrmD [Patescibacteria group bacterium]|jgi:tRNA (guanine37-N1)-methyltransferase